MSAILRHLDLPKLECFSKKYSFNLFLDGGDDTNFYFSRIKENPYLFDTNFEYIDLVEKMDSSFIRFGINENDKFFMESSNSGEVTYENYKEVFRTLTDFKLTFKSLYENKNLFGGRFI